MADLSDASKLKIRKGVIHYKIYAQDESFVKMTLPDNQHNRRLVAWIQVHDRYPGSNK